MNNIPNNIKKYLQKNPLDYILESSDPEVLKRTYGNIIVIPAFAESAFLSKTLETLSFAISKAEEKSLVLIVVNNPPENDCEPEKIADNQTLMEFLRSSGMSNLSWVDASSEGREIKKNGGVGAARKIGMDSALHLLDWETEPLIFSLDADTIVEENYISAPREFFNKNNSILCGTVDFKHQPGVTQEEENAIRLYESYLFDYLDKLREAESPYAYHALGSTIVCRSSAYVKAGGMRPKNGGEDFYFLQAVRKLSPESKIGAINETCVNPSSRPSDRVPFGTGPRIADLISDSKSEIPGRYLYNPEIFAALRRLLTCVNDGSIINSFDKWFESMPDVAKDFLDFCEFRKVWPKILKNTPKNNKKIKWAFHIWFDAFRTLKFIHFCENKDPGKYSRIKNYFYL